MKNKSYRDLEIYQESKRLALEVHKMTLTLPKFEMYEEGDNHFGYNFNPGITWFSNSLVPGNRKPATYNRNMQSLLLTKYTRN